MGASLKKTMRRKASELCREPAAISRLFLQGVISHPNIVLAVARAGKPEWLPNIETRDPWAVLAPRPAV